MLSGWGIVQVAPYGLNSPPPLKHSLRVLIQDIHNLPLLFVFPEILRMAEVAADTGGQRGRDTES